MRLSHVLTSAVMTTRESMRNRLVIVLGLLLPIVFFAIVFATTRSRPVPVELGAATSADPLNIDERRQTLIFIGIAAAGLLASFFAANLVQRRVDASRRLVLCGYRPAELMLARLAILLAIVAVSAIYISLLLLAATRERLPAGVVAGIALGAFVYGCYGLLAGTAFRHDLTTIFAILVLMNIDIGWLQNPIYYHGAQNRWIIRALPGYFPSQTAFLAAFTNDSVGSVALRALAYGLVLFIFATVLYIRRMRVHR